MRVNVQHASDKHRRKLRNCDRYSHDAANTQEHFFSWENVHQDSKKSAQNQLNYLC